MSRSLGPRIRKIEWILPGGNYGIGVGGNCHAKNKTYLVSEIVEDKNTFIEYGHFEYFVYASADGTNKNQFLWQRFMRHPDKIEYFATEEQQEFLS